MQSERKRYCERGAGAVPFWFAAAPLAQIAPFPIQLRPVPPLLPITTAPWAPTAVFS